MSGVIFGYRVTKFLYKCMCLKYGTGTMHCSDEFNRSYKVNMASMYEDSILDHIY